MTLLPQEPRPGTISHAVLPLARAGLGRREICGRLPQYSEMSINCALAYMRSRGLLGKVRRISSPMRLPLLKLLRAGYAQAEAAETLGSSRHSVRVLVDGYRGNGEISPVALHVDGPMWARIEAAAARRKVRPEGLATALLEAIARDDLFLAVLDDGGEG